MAQAIGTSLFEEMILDGEDAKRDAVEGETNLREAIAAAVQKIGEDENSVLAINVYMNELSHRAERIKQRLVTMRTAVKVATGQP